MLSGLKIDSLNFGPSEESLSVREVAEIAEANWTQTVKLDFNNDSLKEQVEAKILKLDSSKSLEILGWKSIWSEPDAVKSTILWWHKVINESSSPNQQCLEDIDFMLEKITKL
jgi:nucleoside-diphosphate-sugar epimerase